MQILHRRLAARTYRRPQTVHFTCQWPVGVCLRRARPNPCPDHGDLSLSSLRNRVFSALNGFTPRLCLSAQACNSIPRSVYDLSCRTATTPRGLFLAAIQRAGENRRAPPTFFTYGFGAEVSRLTVTPISLDRCARRILLTLSPSSFPEHSQFLFATLEICISIRDSRECQPATRLEPFNLVDWYLRPARRSVPLGPPKKYCTLYCLTQVDAHTCVKIGIYMVSPVMLTIAFQEPISVVLKLRHLTGPAPVRHRSSALRQSDY